MKYYEFLELAFNSIEIVIKQEADGTIFPSCDGAPCDLCKIKIECEKVANDNRITRKSKTTAFNKFLEKYPEYRI